MQDPSGGAAIKLYALALTSLICIAAGAQKLVIPPNDPDGRATAEQRLAAGVGASVASLPAAASLTPAQQAARLTQWRATIRNQLFIPSSLPALEAKTWSTFSPMPGVLADRVSYTSAAGMIVPAIVYRPDLSTAHWKGRLPGIVIVNGHGGDKFSWYAFYSGLLFAKAGAMVVTYDPIGEGERNAERISRTGFHDAWVSPPEGLPRTDWGQRLAGLMQVDVMQAVSYLQSRREVDPARIGVAGYSMGGFIVGLTGAIDPRIHAILISGGGVYDGPGGYFDTNPLPCQMPPYKSLLSLGDRGAVLFALNAQRGPTLVMNGSNDTVMDIPHHPPEWFADLHARTVSLLGPNSASARNIFTTIVYPGISHRPSWVERQGVGWLDQQLHFALWNPQAIATMPTTHIAEWAKANDVYLPDTRFDREAGLEALGTGFPGIKREDLMVFPEAAFLDLRDRLIYSAWADKTKLEESKAASHEPHSK